MAKIDIVERQAHHVNGIVLIDRTGRVWLTFSRPWWDLSSILYWWLHPGEKKWMHVHTNTGKKVRVEAVCIATSYVHIGAGNV